MHLDLGHHEEDHEDTKTTVLMLFRLASRTVESMTTMKTRTKLISRILLLENMEIAPSLDGGERGRPRMINLRRDTISVLKPSRNL